MKASGNRRGPDLPYDIIAGVVPCPGGWTVSTGKLVGTGLFPDAPEVVKQFRTVLDHVPGYTVIAVAAPIALPDAADGRGRRCDREARRLVGWPRAGALRSAPCSATLKAKSREAAARKNGGSLDIVSWRLLPRIAELYAEIEPYRQRTVFEVHPELCFYQLNGDRPLRYSKRTEQGQAERRDLLSRRLQSADRFLDVGLRGSSSAHVIDAIAALWTARRISSRAVNRVPEAPEWNADGLRMEIVR
jgi:predicted RNase H-like nuclease